MTVSARWSFSGDRKSTRLNSSHVAISYAVCSLASFPTRRSSDLGGRAGVTAGFAHTSMEMSQRRSDLTGDGYQLGVYGQLDMGRLRMTGVLAHGRTRYDGQRKVEFLRRSEEHTSELQSRGHLVCRLLPCLFPYTTLFRSGRARRRDGRVCPHVHGNVPTPQRSYRGWLSTGRLRPT